jgi:hypothetical protein
MPRLIGALKSWLDIWAVSHSRVARVWLGPGFDPIDCAASWQAPIRSLNRRRPTSSACTSSHHSARQCSASTKRVPAKPASLGPRSAAFTRSRRTTCRHNCCGSIGADRTSVWIQVDCRRRLVACSADPDSRLRADHPESER